MSKKKRMPWDIPDKKASAALEVAFADLEPDLSMKRDRPYIGQPHTSLGKRGQTEVRGVTFRDLRDCFIRAMCFCADPDIPTNRRILKEARKGENANLNGNAVYAVEGNIDPLAIWQNMACEIEKIMGIYPNIEPLKADTVEGKLEEIGAPMIRVEDFFKEDDK